MMAKRFETILDDRHLSLVLWVGSRVFKLSITTYDERVAVPLPEEREARAKFGLLSTLYRYRRALLIETGRHWLKIGPQAERYGIGERFRFRVRAGLNYEAAWKEWA